VQQLSSPEQQLPQFAILDVDEDNWADWCAEADQQIQQLSRFAHWLSEFALQELIKTEQMLALQLNESSETPIDAAPMPAVLPTQYPILLPGQEHVLQRKLDLWNRFQLAQGVLPSTGRLVVAASIVGGTIYAGLVYA